MSSKKDDNFDNDDDFIRGVLDKQSARAGKSVLEQSNEPMSKNKKDMVRGKSVVTKKEAEAITDWKEMQKIQAEFKKKYNLSNYRFDEIKQDGNALTIDQDKVRERNLTDVKLVDAMIKENNRLPKGVAHYTTGETVMLKAPEDYEQLKKNEEGKEISNREEKKENNSDVQS